MALLELTMPFKSHVDWAAHLHKQVQRTRSAVAERRRPMLGTDDIDDGKGAACAKTASASNQQDCDVKKTEQTRVSQLTVRP